jgi:hypothetical protein
MMYRAAMQVWGVLEAFDQESGYMRRLTTLRVPTNSLGGSIPVVQIIWMKLEQMPMTRIMQRA